MQHFVVILSCFLISSVFSQSPVDPKDEFLNTTELLKKYNYPYEYHTVTTIDGYELILHRIRSTVKDGSNKVIFLNHGFISSDHVWVARGPGHALGYILADAGYDVWMINNRGNGVSMEGPDDFWDYSLDDVALYDTSAAIDYILEQTNQRNLSFIGHSQGNTMYFMLCLERPEYEEKINKYIGLAPLLNMKYILRDLKNDNAPRSLHYDWGKQLSIILRQCYWGSIVTCQINYLNMHGYTPAEVPYAFLRIILSHYPSGGSSKNQLHVTQFIGKEDIHKYDYGTSGNIEHYGQTKPPIYNLNKVAKTPKYIFYGSMDKVLAPGGVEHGLSKLTNLQQVHKVYYAHNDFVMGWSVQSTINHKILNILSLD